MTKTLWEVMRNKLDFSIDMCDEIVDAVEEFLPKVEELLTEDIEVPLDAYKTGYEVGVETTLTEIYKKLR